MVKKKVSEQTKEKIAKLVDLEYITKLLSNKLPQYYKDFKKIETIELDPFKRHLGVTSAVFVVEYKIKYLTKSNKNKNLNIFVSAHSDGSRKGAYIKTKFLYNHGFKSGKYRVTKPLFFLPSKKAFFYEASIGRSFFNFFSQQPSANLDTSLSLISGWVKKLHKFNTKKYKFNWPRFYISKMIPYSDKFIKDFITRDKKQGKQVERLFNNMVKLEKGFSKTFDKKVIYGDFHPENVIITNLNAKSLEMIDFNDLSLGDPMMDLGIFIQQFDFMGHNFVSRKKINKYKLMLIEKYFNKKIKDIDIKYINRINLYQSWTALRTATFLFYMKDVNNPINDLLKDCENYLVLASSDKKIINLH